jgi:putative transposase
LARSPRIQYYGAIYHIIHEGKGNIFNGDEDKIKLLEIIEGVKANSGLFVIGIFYFR